MHIDTLEKTIRKTAWGLDQIPPPSIKKRRRLLHWLNHFETELVKANNDRSAAMKTRYEVEKVGRFYFVFDRSLDIYVNRDGDVDNVGYITQAEAVAVSNWLEERRNENLHNI